MLDGGGRRVTEGGGVLALPQMPLSNSGTDGGGHLLLACLYRFSHFRQMTDTNIHFKAAFAATERKNTQATELLHFRVKVQAFKNKKWIIK